jgi:hypothetical protein
MKNKEAAMDNKTLKESLALRAHYEQRACPPDEVFASPSVQLQAHLGYCRYCNERLTLTVADLAAWEEIANRLSPECERSCGKKKVRVGQIWSLNACEVGGWGPYDRYYTPPLVLILEVQDKGSTFRVAPVCGEKDLRAEDGTDVWLGDHIGFAESWNIFSVHRDTLKGCKETVEQSFASQVLDQSRVPRPDAEFSLLILQFRELETQVASFVAMRALPRVMEETETATEWLSAAIGSLAEVRDRVVNAAKGWRFPQPAVSVFDFLTGAEPELFPGQAANIPEEQLVTINHVSATEAGVLVGTRTARITDVQGQGDSFSILGRLIERTDETLHLVARFSMNDVVRESEPFTIRAGSRGFVVVFKEVSPDLCKLHNVKSKVKMLLVST